VAEQHGIIIDNFRKEAWDYCRSFKIVVKEKLEFITKLMNFDEKEDKEKFKAQCATGLS
jgi:hypothetical protein